jgi:hypothetical protein
MLASQVQKNYKFVLLNTLKDKGGVKPVQHFLLSVYLYLHQNSI